MTPTRPTDTAIVAQLLADLATARAERDAALERVAWLEGLERLRIERRAEAERTRRRWVTP